MNVFFDVDETIQAYDGSLRPAVADIFRRLTEDGHRVYVWSGARTALGVRMVVARHGLEVYVSACFQKPLDVDPRRAWLQAGNSVLPDFCIDDYPGIVDAFGGVVIAPYATPLATDDHMYRVYEAVCAAAALTRCVER